MAAFGSACRLLCFWSTAPSCSRRKPKASPLSQGGRLKRFLLRWCTTASPFPSSFGCGQTCGACEEWQACAEGVCEEIYPPPPYGQYAGDIPPDQTFLEHATLTPVTLSSSYGQGKLLLVTFTSTWCKVCQNDTVLLNQWHAQWQADGLHVI